MKDKKIITILTIFTIIFTFFGGTLAYWNWSTSEAEKTNVTFTVTRDFSCAADGGGNISSTDNKIVPADCLNTNYAIQRTVTVTPTINRSGVTVYMDLWLDIESIGSGLTNSNYFMYALTESPTSCVSNPKASGTFKGKTAEDQIKLLDQEPYTTSGARTYYLYIWLHKDETSTSTMDQPFNLTLGGQCSDTLTTTSSGYIESILNGTDPVLEPGMIPVTISDTGAVTSADTSQAWYSYQNKEWANAVLVNSTVRGTYINQDGTINGNLPINETDILAYYVWIPRYKYTFPNANGNPEPISIVFENASTPKSVPASGSASGTDYYTHPAFTFGTNNELNGIWVGKFETAHTTLSSNTTNDNLGCSTTDCENANGLIIKPNVTSLRYNSVSNFFYASRSMTRTSNPFGLTTSTDTHMMKNSEWGAVAYLSHSVYGINQEVEINSNSSYTTGAGNGTTYGTPIEGTHTYPQSTTGNISGVFDMSGGSYEYVMGVLADSNGEPRSGYDASYNSGFKGIILDNMTDEILYEDGLDFPNEKYYDKYTVNDYSECTLSECGGHALHETKGWYSDTANFVNFLYPWFSRGGHYFNGVAAGIFYSIDSSGAASTNLGTSFRSVAIKGA